MNGNHAQRGLGWWLLAAGLLPALAALAEETLEQGRQRLEQMRANGQFDELDQLRRKQERFGNLPPEEQQRIRELHASIASRPDADRLYGVLHRYNEWLKTLTSEQRAELDGLPIDRRIARIKELQQQQEIRNFGLLGDSKLSPEDYPRLLAWLEGFVRRHAQEIVGSLPPEYQTRFRQIEDPRKQTQMLMIVMARRRPGQTGQLSPQPTREDVKLLLESLSDEAKTVFESAPDTRRKTVLVQRWVQAAVIAKMAPAVSADQLKTFFDQELTKEEREELDRLPPEHRERQLRQKYYARQIRRMIGGPDIVPRVPGDGPPAPSAGNSDLPESR